MTHVLACQAHSWCEGGHVKPWIGIPVLIIGFAVLAGLGLLNGRRR